MKRTNLPVICLGLLLSCLPAIAEEHPANPGETKSPEPATYQIRNQKYHELLRPQDANGATGTRLVLYAPQPWKCMTWRLQPAGGSAFRVQNLFTAKTFMADANTNRAQSVVQVSLKNDPTEAPTWQFTRLEDGTYKITDGKSGKVLTAARSDHDRPVKFVVESWRNQDGQKWELLKIDPKQLTM